MMVTGISILIRESKMQADSGHFFKKIFIYFFSFLYLFFGCVGSQLWHAGSSLRHVGSCVVVLWLFVVVHGLLFSCGMQVFSSPVAARGLQSTWALQFVAHGLSLRRRSSVVVACGLSCPVACGILVPQPGIEPVSPALKGRFFTTGPPGKSPGHFFFLIN